MILSNGVNGALLECDFLLCITLHNIYIRNNYSYLNDVRKQLIASKISIIIDKINGLVTGII